LSNLYKRWKIQLWYELVPCTCSHSKIYISSLMCNQWPPSFASVAQTNALSQVMILQHNKTPKQHMPDTEDAVVISLETLDPPSTCLDHWSNTQSVAGSTKMRSGNGSLAVTMNASAQFITQWNFYTCGKIEQTHQHASAFLQNNGALVEQMSFIQHCSESSICMTLGTNHYNLITTTEGINNTIYLHLLGRVLQNQMCQGHQMLPSTCCNKSKCLNTVLESSYKCTL
jgi:hypothetical protein